VNPVLDLPLNEGKGATVYDRSGMDNNGTLFGPTWQKVWRDWLLKFDGIDDYLSVPTSPSLRPTRVTVEVWFKMAQKGVWQGLVDVWNGVSPPSPNFRLQIRDTNQLRWGCTVNGTWAIYDSIKVLDVDVWYHAVATFDGNKLKMYIEGKFDSELDAVGDLQVEPQDLFVGCYGNKTMWFKGIIAFVRICKKALTTDQITFLATLFRGEKRSPP